MGDDPPSDGVPGRTDDLRRWLATLLSEGKAVSTLKTYLAGVGYRHRRLGRSNPANDEGLRAFLHGATRRSAGRGRRVRQAKPLRWVDIEGIFASLGSVRRNQPGGREETPEQARYRARREVAMLAVAYDAGLRSSELQALVWDDVYICGDDQCGLIEVRRSKTDQTGQGAIVPISAVCVAALASLRAVGAEPESRIFDMSASTVNRRIKSAAAAAGINPADIASHSPRIGLAQDLAAHNIEMPALMQAGRWKTPATAARYTQHLNALHTPTARCLRERNVRQSGASL